MTNDVLEQQIKDARHSISSDGYPMSIGELTNLYRDRELIIRPEFQRLFRWSPIQKSRLIESILLGIPLPSIFVAQTEKGAWELVDGLQRLSTILELQGELRDDVGFPVPPLKLLGTKYLPSLEGRVWSDEDPAMSLSEALRLDFKRSKLDVKIIKRESSARAKFDLFQRLNSYGSQANSSEMRTALLVAASPDFFSWMSDLARYFPFVESVALGDRLIDERYDLELVARFLVLHNRPKDMLTLSQLRDLPQLLDDETVKLAEKYPLDTFELENIFKSTFDLIFEHGGEFVFKKWDVEKGDFKGSFLNTSFEVFALGVGYHIANGTRCRRDLIEATKEFWGMPKMRRGFATGRSTEARLVDFIPLGRHLTSAEREEVI